MLRLIKADGSCGSDGFIVRLVKKCGSYSEKDLGECKRWGLEVVLRMEGL